MDWPEVTIGIITYNRPNEIQRTAEALKANLAYPADRLRWLVSDDSSPDGYLSKLKRSKTFKDLNVRFITTASNGGWGKNAQNLLANLDTDYLFQLEDDKLLYKPLDLRIGVALLESHPDIGYLRYKGTAGMADIFHQFEADIRPWLPDHMDGPAAVQGKLTYLQLDSGSPDLYLYTHGPHLKHRRFHEFYGPYPEGLKLGPTEESYCHTVKDGMKRPGAPALTILPDWVLPYFEDFGQSWQNSEWDK